jgi:hypothetical protein
MAVEHLAPELGWIGTGHGTFQEVGSTSAQHPDSTKRTAQTHLLYALRDFECFYNAHRPHQGIANARLLHPLRAPLTDPDRIARLEIRRRDRLGGILHEYQHAA